MQTTFKTTLLIIITLLLTVVAPSSSSKLLQRDTARILTTDDLTPLEEPMSSSETEQIGEEELMQELPINDVSEEAMLQSLPSDAIEEESSNNIPEPTSTAIPINESVIGSTIEEELSVDEQQTMTPTDMADEIEEFEDDSSA